MRRYRALVLYAAAVASLWLAWHHLAVDQGDAMRSLALVEGQVRAHPAAAALGLAVASALLTYLSFPAMPLVYIAAGYCLGALQGGLSVLLGSACGGFGAFLLYRRYMPERFRQPSAAMRPARAWLTLLGLRLSPIVPAPFVSCFAVFMEASSFQFLTTTILGSAPLILFYEAMGQEGRGLVHGIPMDWTQVTLYAAVVLVSTLLSLLGPWRSFLAAVRGVKDEMFAAMARRTPPSLAKVPLSLGAGEPPAGALKRS